MREALEEAKRATEAAWQAVKVSETTAINQLRAYVGPVDFEIMFTESNEILVAFKIKNTGQTPAINVQLAYCITFLELPIDDSDVDIDAQILDEEQASAFLPKDVTFSAKTDVLNDYDTTKKILCLQGTHAVFVYGKVAYKDIYGQPRTTKFRVAWGKSFRNTQLKNMALCDDGNEMT
ncbi:MAG: hypothetical protein COA69_07755 [Robiginitomaculum sp.]|nr:MAG: hypothetical protein COA69_07755 [Robiginitomaculum sp.]